MKACISRFSPHISATVLSAIVYCSLATLANAQGSTNCAFASPGLVSWWRGEGNLLDASDGNNGILVGNATYGPSKVGQGFVFDGNGDAVLAGNPANLQLQDFTIEAWIKRASTSYVSSGPGIDALFLGYGAGGYGFGLDRTTGQPLLTRVEVDQVTGNTSVTDTNFHHVAVTKSGATVIFYVDGTAYPAPVYNTTYTFSTSVAIGARGDNFGNSFYGSIDELAVYNRALAANEIQAIYSARSAGKCTGPVAPFILSQPANQTVNVGANVTFAVTAGGTAPLSYQWSFNGTNINGATSSSLALTNVQFADAGNYSVVVSNSVGTTNSSNAALTVSPLPSCASPAFGLISWWRGEGNLLDANDGNNAILVGNAAYSSGKVGQGFVFDGNGDAVLLGNPANLQLQDFTIEAWIKRATTAYVSSGPGVDAVFFSYGAGGFGFGLDRTTGRPMLSQIDVDAVTANTSVADTNFHHVGVTKSGANVVFYVDGVAYSAPAYSPGFAFSTSVAIGARGDNFGNSFYGSIDELAVYNRALAANEIQAIYTVGSAGKCTGPTRPYILSQPTNQTVVAGGTATFVVTAGGTAPLSYQWSFNGTNINGATASSIVLTNVQFANAGAYSVVVSNSAGTTNSSNAMLTVNFPPASVLVMSVGAVAGGTVALPVALVANGNENALGFSLSFDNSRLSYTGVTVGSGASGAALVVNTNEIGSGKLGVALALAAGTTFAFGTQEVVQVGFTAAIVTNATSTTINFGDVPIERQLSDAPGNVLPATYASGNVLIAPVAFEGDVSPRPNGNQNVTITDWVLVGRYAARLDYPTNATEYQRADCAPRESLGNGAITVTDWVQAGRYVAKLDPFTPVGGPTSDAPPLSLALSGLGPRRGNRQLQITDALLVQNQVGNVCVNLTAVGDENALGFSLTFDPATSSFAGATLGSGATGATLNLNTNQTGSGKLGLVLALPTGTTFGAGTKELVKVNLRASGSASGSYPVAFANQPVPGEISDAAAHTLSAGYLNGTVAINPPPSLAIARADQDITLSWPLWATNFTLQVAENSFPPVTWTNVSGTVGITNAEHVITLPINGGMKFYRLSSP